MKKRLIPLLAALLLLCACAAPAPAPTEAPVHTVEPPPLTEYATSLAVPDFLTDEQKALYRSACSLYLHMWSGETGAIDDFPLREGEEPLSIYTYDSFEADGMRYLYTIGRYQSWDEFEALILSVFTQELFDERNEQGGFPVYREQDGRLCFVDLSMGKGINYNGAYFPDVFELTHQSDDKIQFTVTGHFSERYPKEGETIEQRSLRLETAYEYTLSTDLELVLTPDGWRFSRFELAGNLD